MAEDQVAPPAARPPALAVQKGPKLRTPPFDPHGDRIDMGRKWEKWLERFERELKYKGVDPGSNDSSDMSQMALLIHVGTEVEDIHDTLPTPVKPEDVLEADWNEYRKSVTKLTTYFSPKQSNDFALHQMMGLKPTPGESVADYATRLRKAGDKCSFANWTKEKMIKCILISNIQDEQLQLKFLQREHTLDEILDVARKKEDATARRKIMREEEKANETVNVLGRGRNRNGRNNQRSAPKKRAWPRAGEAERRAKKDECTRCGHERHDFDDCPANGATCGYCRGKGHFSRKCYEREKDEKRKAVKAVNTSEDDSATDTDEESVRLIEAINKLGKGTSLMKIKTNGCDTRWQPDTGATRNIWDERQLRTFEEAYGKQVTLEKTGIKLYPYGSDRCLTILGKFRATLEAGDSCVETWVYVSKEKSKYPLLSEASSRKLKLLQYNEKFLVSKLSVGDEAGGAKMEARAQSVLLEMEAGNR